MDFCIHNSRNLQSDGIQKFFLTKRKSKWQKEREKKNLTEKRFPIHTILSSFFQQCKEKKTIFFLFRFGK